MPTWLKTLNLNLSAWASASGPLAYSIMFVTLEDSSESKPIYMTQTSPGLPLLRGCKLNWSMPDLVNRTLQVNVRWFISLSVRAHSIMHSVWPVQMFSIYLISFDPNSQMILPFCRHVACSWIVSSGHSTHRRSFVVIFASCRTASSNITSQRTIIIHSQPHRTWHAACQWIVSSEHPTRQRFFVVIFTSPRTASSNTTLQWTIIIHSQPHHTQ